jgi:hypothetical protein
MTASLCAAGHTIPNRHTQDPCPDADCTGCLPAPAEPGSRTCTWHNRRTREGLHELPDLWAELGDPLTARQRDTGSDGTPALGLSDDRRNARTAIRTILVTWCRILEDDYAITLPTEEAIAATTRQLAHQASAGAMRARSDSYRHATTATDLRRNGADPTLVDHELHAAHNAARRSTTLDTDATRHRADRETGRDVIAHLAEHIDRQLERLLNSPEHAEQLLADIHGHTDDEGHHHPGILRTAWRLARPGRRAAVTVECTCGARVPLEVDPSDPTSIIRCDHCSEWGTITWWRERAAPPLDGPITASEAITWAVLERGIVLTDVQIRRWASNGLITRQGKDDKGRTLYDRDQVLAAHYHTQASGKRRRNPA